MLGESHFQQARAWLLLVLTAVLAACSGGVFWWRLGRIFTRRCQ
jgi:membrane protein YqaA with SNARE-associated domain